MKCQCHNQPVTLHCVMKDFENDIVWSSMQLQLNLSQVFYLHRNVPFLEMFVFLIFVSRYSLWNVFSTERVQRTFIRSTHKRIWQHPKNWSKRFVSVSPLNTAHRTPHTHNIHSTSEMSNVCFYHLVRLIWLTFNFSNEGMNCDSFFKA